jgi:hypothetical protein
LRGPALAVRAGRCVAALPTVGRPALGWEVEPSVEVRRLKVTGKRRVERMQRVSEMLSMRLQGASLAQIGEAYGITFQAVHKALKVALKDMVIEPLEQVRSFELMRLDELLSAIYERALGGDIAYIDRVLAISYRRARLLGLDLQTGGTLRFGDHGPYETNAFDDQGRPLVRVEIVNSPEAARREWLLQKRITALGGDPNIDDEPPHSVN